MIDLRSDTVTQPTAAMKEAMIRAKLGDDVFHEDPTVNELESKVAGMFGKESALFCPSGTMTNQIAIKVHTQPGDEVICDKTAHVYNYEGGGIGFNSGASVRLTEGNLGRFTADDVLNCINPDNDHFPHSALVCIENTVNRGGGSIWDINEIRKIRQVCIEHKLKTHLDGARLFNALTETGEKPENYGELFDSVSICLSKGLGAPVGSVLCGNSEFIRQARRYRKILGGSMRQAGIIAAAGIYALENHVDLLKHDHFRAAELAKVISNLDFCEEIMPVSTNIIIFTLHEKYQASAFIERLRSNHILALAIGNRKIRMVTHLDFSDDMLEYVIRTLKKLG